MNKKIAIIYVFLFSMYNNSYAQNQTNFWYFGLNCGIDFSSGSPVVLSNGNTATNEATSSISDNSGNLLFYSDGVQVWNKNNIQMPNGFGLLGDVSTTQMMITPNPGNANLYYIFTIDDEGGGDGLNYSVVDMTLQGGNGDVTVKNVLLRNVMTEKLAAVYHCNNHDIWVMTHDRFTNAFVAFLITDLGINPPVISNIGLPHTDVHGQIKFSNDGKKLACALGYSDTLEVFDFNKSTGLVSNPVSIPVNHHTYGIEFSPDNTKLYATYYDIGAASSLVQYDLTAPVVASSQVIISSDANPIYYSLQLARDNKIYVTKEITPFLGVINDPNVQGMSCNYVDNVINLDPLGTGAMCMLGLPGFVQSFFNPQFPTIPCVNLSAGFINSDTVLCNGQCINFTDMSAGPVASREWNFQGGTPSTSTALNPTNICYNSPGNYEAMLIVSDGVNTDTIRKQIMVLTPPIVNAGSDETIIPGDSVTLHATGNLLNYIWSPSAGLSDVTIANPIAFPVTTTTYYVTGTDGNNCSALDSITINIEIPCGEIFVPTAFSPNNDLQNDMECVLGDCIVSMKFTIYDRWGEKVFETTDQKICWDGNYKGQVMNTATFVYSLSATLINGKEIIKKGNISLIR